MGARNLPYITYTIRHKNGGCCTALFRCTCNVGHADTDDEADDWSEEPDKGIAGDRCRSTMRPAAAPNHGAASDDRQATKYQQYEANVRYATGEVPCE